MIDITGIDLVKFAKEVYALSRPMGLGMLHYRPGELDDATAQILVDTSAVDTRIALNMDYVHGRGCKMVVFRDGQELSVRNTWYDHSEEDLDELLRRVGVER